MEAELENWRVVRGRRKISIVILHGEFVVHGEFILLGRGAHSARDRLQQSVLGSGEGDGGFPEQYFDLSG
ncbi:hypothetical protein AKJ16_DCAP03085 [Drosera capensis]